jgi:site-specific DNA-cytosine methylase
VVRRAAAAGYQLYPKLLDSAWFGVPQNRSRFFLIGLHRDLGYRPDAFGKWGPFPRPTHGPSGRRPYVTLREAIADLPPIANGHDVDELPYEGPKGPLAEFLAFVRQGAPAGVVWDHVVSTHAEYVIERYRRIPPGSNWSAIAHMMTNYAAIERTHSNIYRRLIWDEPSITVGHYRKAMLIHPDQHRGLSLREAARLQSFPDWFRFAGTNQGARKGVSYKQQQIANAVCPMLAKALAERLLGL